MGVKWGTVKWVKWGTGAPFPLRTSAGEWCSCPPIRSSAGRLATETAYGRALSYQYDLAGNRTRVTWPDAFYVQYDFDAANRMVKARENGATSGVEVLATFAYDDLGRRISLLRGSGSLTSYDYDDADRITDLAHNADGTLQDQTYTFAWSPANQLIERSASNALYKWTEPPDGTVTYAHNGLDRISAFVALGGYDARGNLVSDGSRVFGYDLENRLTCAKLGSGTCTNNPTLTLAYDPAGRLRQTNAPGGAGITQFLYDGERLLAEYDDAGTLLRRYVHCPGVGEPLDGETLTG